MHLSQGLKKIYRAGGHTDSPKTANKTTVNFFFFFSFVLLFLQRIFFEDLILTVFAHLAEPLRIVSLLFFTLSAPHLSSPSPLFLIFILPHPFHPVPLSRPRAQTHNLR